MSERRKGWYHVKDENGFWQCAQWNGYAWHGVFVENGLDDYWQEIGQRVPTPDEPWQTVPVEPTHAMHLAGESAYEGGMSEYPDPSSMYREMLEAAPRPGGGDD